MQTQEQEHEHGRQDKFDGHHSFMAHFEAATTTRMRQDLQSLNANGRALVPKNNS